MKFVLSILLTTMLFCGCSTTTVRERPLALRVADAQLDSTPLVEALLDQPGVFVQSVDASWNDRTFEAQCVRKCDGEKLTVIFLAPQMRLVTITVERPHLVRCERVAQIPRTFEPEYALADLAYVNLGTVTLQRCLAPALKVEDDGKTRRIVTMTGQTAIEITRHEDGGATLRNVEHGYTYTMRPLE